MNQYKKKKNFLQALLEFESVKFVLGTIAIIAGACAMTFVGHLLLMTPLLSELNDESWAECRFMELMIGFSVFGIGLVIIMGIARIPAVIIAIRTNLHAAKIIQYLPLTKEDWKAQNVKTNREAIQTLRELIHDFGYTDDFYCCNALRNDIRRSYRSFIKSVYEDDTNGKIWNELNSIDDIILCTDEDLEQILQRSLNDRDELRRKWEQKHGAVSDSVKENADTSV